jgi:hypothetical protein
MRADQTQPEMRIIACSESNVLAGYVEVASLLPPWTSMRFDPSQSVLPSDVSVTRDLVRLLPYCMVHFVPAAALAQKHLRDEDKANLRALVAAGGDHLTHARELASAFGYLIAILPLSGRAGGYRKRNEVYASEKFPLWAAPLVLLEGDNPLVQMGDIALPPLA